MSFKMNTADIALITVWPIILCVYGNFRKADIFLHDGYLYFKNRWIIDGHWLIEKYKIWQRKRTPLLEKLRKYILWIQIMVFIWNIFLKSMMNVPSNVISRLNILFWYNLWIYFRFIVCIHVMYWMLNILSKLESIHVPLFFLVSTCSFQIFISILSGK